jgi:hypothetical protein
MAGKNNTGSAGHAGRTILVILLVPVALAVPVILVKMVAKQTDPTLPAELLRRYEVVTTEYYGVRLDEKAAPRDVAYVLLRSIEEGAAAANAPTSQQQIEGLRKAREIQLATAAPIGILQYLGANRAELTDADTNAQELVLRMVLSWSRMLQYYIGGFGLNRSDARQEIHEAVPTGQPPRAIVRFPAVKNPYRTQVVVRFIREADRWRIYAVNLTDLPTTAPAVVPRSRPAVAPPMAPATRAKPGAPAVAPASVPASPPPAAPSVPASAAQTSRPATSQAGK